MGPNETVRIPELFVSTKLSYLLSVVQGDVNLSV